MKVIDPEMPSKLAPLEEGWVYVGTEPFPDNGYFVNGLIAYRGTKWDYDNWYCGGSGLHHAVKIGSKAYQMAIQHNLITE